MKPRWWPEGLRRWRLPRLPGPPQRSRMPGGFRFRLPERWRIGALGTRLQRWSPPPIPGGLRLWITLVSIGFLLAALLSNGRQLVQLRPDPQGWLWLLLGVGVSLLSLVVNGLSWGVVLRWLGLRPRWEPLVILHVSTNLRKFIPGGIWHLASRVQTLRQGEGEALPAPLGTARALLAVLLEPLLAAIAALALVPLGGWQNGLALLCLMPLLLLRPRWLAPLLLRLERRRARELGLEQELAGEGGGPSAPLVRGYPLVPLLAQMVFILLRFGGMACCVWAFDLELVLEWSTWLAGFAFAWTVGLVVPGAPGGFGVFETVLLLRLGDAMPEPQLLAVALSYRLVTTLADLLGAGVVGADEHLRSTWTGRTAAAMGGDAALQPASVPVAGTGEGRGEPDESPDTSQ